MLSQQESIGHLIGTARRRIKQAVLSRVRSLRLSPLQFWFLVALDEQSGAPLGELAERQRVDAPTASRVIKALHKRGLVRLRADASDRRRTRIELSSAGRALLPQLRPIASSVRASVLEGMSAAEEQALRATLRKIIGNLERYEQQAARREKPGAGAPRPPARPRRAS